MMQKHDVNMYSSLEFSTLRVAECFLDPGRQTCVKEAWLSFQLNIRLRLLFLYKALQKSASLLCCSAFCTFSSGSHIHWTQRPRQRCSLSLRRKCHRMDQVRCFTIQCFTSTPLPFTFLPHGAISCMMTLSKLLSAEEKGRGARGRGGQQKESLHNSCLYNNRDHNGQQTFSLLRLCN